MQTTERESGTDYESRPCLWLIPARADTRRKRRINLHKLKFRWPKPDVVAVLRELPVHKSDPRKDTLTAFRRVYVGRSILRFDGSRVDSCN